MGGGLHLTGRRSPGRLLLCALRTGAQPTSCTLFFSKGPVQLKGSAQPLLMHSLFQESFQFGACIGAPCALDALDSTSPHVHPRSC